MKGHFVCVIMLFCRNFDKSFKQEMIERYFIRMLCFWTLSIVIFLFKKQGFVDWIGPHAYEEGQKICWIEARVLQIEPNTTCRKYKESVHMSLVAHPISQPSSDMSPIWNPVITA
jgi:hypothetical protein